MNKKFDDFDKDFNRTHKFIYIIWVIQLTVILVVFGFIGWVIVQLMRFFGVI